MDKYVIYKQVGNRTLMKRNDWKRFEEIELISGMTKKGEKYLQVVVKNNQQKLI